MLNKKHLKILKKSGIKKDVALHLGLSSASGEESRRILKRNKSPGPGFVIPYYDPETREQLKYTNKQNSKRPYTRIRLDKPLKIKGRNDAKYLSIHASGSYPYIIPEVYENIKSGNHTIYFTEGEKKSITGYAHGLNVIGLSGNYGWKMTGKWQLHPMLDKLITKERDIVVIWDSDAALNKGFAHSTKLLHQALLKKGCKLKVVVLPQDTDEKVGLDDYLTKSPENKKKLTSLINSTEYLPDEVQTNDYFFLSWNKQLKKTFAGLQAPQIEYVLDRYYTKGLVDGVSHKTRKKIIRLHTKWSGIDCHYIFKGATIEYLEKNFDKSSFNNKTNLKLGDSVITIDGKSLGTIVGMEESLYAWVEKNNISKPYPIDSLASKRVDTQDPKLITQAIIESNFITDGYLSLRFFRGEWYHYTKGQYAVLSADDFNATVMSLLQDFEGVFSTKSLLASIIANMKSKNFSHISSSQTPPLLLEPIKWKN